MVSGGNAPFSIVASNAAEADPGQQQAFHPDRFVAFSVTTWEGKVICSH